MSKNQELYLPKRHLTDDEIVNIPANSKRTRELDFRIRVWRGEGLMPVVLASLASPVYKSWADPGHWRVKLANYGVAVAGYPDNSILYFDCFVKGPGEAPELRQVLFEYYGCAHRLRLFKPEQRLRNWGSIEYVVGGKVIP